MTLTKWNTDLIDIEGLDELVEGEMEDYLPLEGGTLTGELTVDANLILEGTITEGTRNIPYDEDKRKEDFVVLPPPGDMESRKYEQFIYVISPSQGTMQHLTVGLNSFFQFTPDPAKTESYNQEDPDYFFQDGQSMTLRVEVDDLDKHKPDILYSHRWDENIWWVNTKDGLAPDVNETGAVTVNLWKAKGVLYGQLAGDFVKQPAEYHLHAFDLSWIEYNRGSPTNNQYHPYDKRNDAVVFGNRVGGPSQQPAKNDPFVWSPEGGIQERQGTTFARISRDGRHLFIGQSGSDGWSDPGYPKPGVYPGELRVFGNGDAYYPVPGLNKSTPSVRGITFPYSYSTSPLFQPFAASWTGRVDRDRPSTDSQLFGTATDMRLRVDKGTGVDFNPDGTRMFQSVARYHDPSLKDKYKNVIGAHHLTTPWDVGTTDFLIKEELNDIIYCDEKYSEVQALHPDMRVCCLTFRPDGMGFYFAYVVHSTTKRDIEYYFVQQDLEVPWELSSAKEEYKYSDKITHAKGGTFEPEDWEDEIPRDKLDPSYLWQINGMTVSNNGRFIHAVYPHDYKVHKLTGRPYRFGFPYPRQFEMTTPWDISTAGNMYEGLGVNHNVPGAQANYPSTYCEGGNHGVHWNESGESCYFSHVTELLDESGKQQRDPQHLKRDHNTRKYTLSKWDLYARYKHNGLN